MFAQPDRAAEIGDPGVARQHWRNHDDSGQQRPGLASRLFSIMPGL
jgi:hypothetical protein